MHQNMRVDLFKLLFRRFYILSGDAIKPTSFFPLIIIRGPSPLQSVASPTIYIRQSRQQETIPNQMLIHYYPITYESRYIKDQYILSKICYNKQTMLRFVIGLKFCRTM